MKINIPSEILDEQRREMLIEHHHLAGWLYTHAENTNQYEFLKDQWLRQISLNEDQRQVWNEIIEKWPERLERPVVLKGMAFELMNLYGPGERFKSDIDLLIDKESMEFIISKLKIKYQIKEVLEKKWWGNAHKVTLEFEKNENHIVIEFHQQIFYHLPNIDWKKYRSQDNPFLLEHHAHIVFLMGHFVFQHNCLKLYWLLDIALILDHFKNLNFEKLESIAKEWKLKRSLEWSLYLVDQFYQLETTIPKKYLKINTAVSLGEIWMGQQAGLKYWLRKHQCKDSLLQAISYDLRWLFK